MSMFDEMRQWGMYDVIREDEVRRRVALGAEFDRWAAKNRPARVAMPAALPAKRKPVAASRSPKAESRVALRRSAASVEKAVASSTKRSHGRKGSACKR